MRRSRLRIRGQGGARREGRANDPSGVEERPVMSETKPTPPTPPADASACDDRTWPPLLKTSDAARYCGYKSAFGLLKA